MKKLKPYLTGTWYSLPVQLLLLHFKRYQLLLVFWYILFATVNGSFMHSFGAYMLYLSPEYMGSVSGISLALVGAAVAIFIMSWNITTFILHARHIRFLATTTQPFLKYCINNAVIPLAFLVFYFYNAVQYGRVQELLSYGNIWWLAAGFLGGFIASLALGFTYFFRADKSIYRRMAPHHRQDLLRHKNRFERPNTRREKGIIRVDWYLSATLKRRRPRSVRHYSDEFIERILKQHHLAALFSVLVAFVSLIVVGYFLDHPFFQIPAAASITVFFAILIAVAGAFSYFLQNWTILFVLGLFLGLNHLYQLSIFNPRNKAYGIDYTTQKPMPQYNRLALAQLASPANISADSLAFIELLNRWKQRQASDTPVFCLIAVSGGGTRSAAFTTQVLQRIDSLCGNRLMPSTFVVSGASGGMMGAAWYRELYLRKTMGLLSDSGMAAHLDDITQDLLNPLFTSIVARDLLAPPMRFTYNQMRYTKDRGYAFEHKLDENTNGWMGKTLGEYKMAEDSAPIPRLLINSVITRDGRKMLLGTRPARFLMQPTPNNASNLPAGPDAVDFTSYFAGRQPHKLRLLTALRMNATFPYILPNVWLPTQPVIDVMDAGFRDNTGLESGLKFLYYFKEWLQANCARVVIIQIRDKPQGGWDSPYESDNIFDMGTKPALLTQNNLFHFQEYAQLREMEWFQQLYGEGCSRVLFEYTPFNKVDAASLSFHLSQREKRDLRASLKNAKNKAAFEMAAHLLQARP